MAVYIIQPLGRDFNEGATQIGPATQIRCTRALEEARRLRNDGHMVYILVSPSLPRDLRRKGTHKKTMAVMMAEWFESNGWNQLITNHTDMIPFDTMGEVAWAVGAIQRFSPVFRQYGEVIYVPCSSRRHLRRIRHILSWFHRFRRNVCYIASHEQPPGWLHECAAYLKMVLVYKKWWPISR